MIIEICLIIITCFIVIFVIGLLFVSFQIRRTAKETEKFLETARQQVVPLSHDLTIILNDSKNIVHSVEKQIVKIEEGVEAVKDTAINIKQFEANIQDRIQQPIMELSALISIVAKVLRGILDYLKDKK